MMFGCRWGEEGRTIGEIFPISRVSLSAGLETSSTFWGFGKETQVLTRVTRHAMSSHAAVMPAEHTTGDARFQPRHQ